ncbi:MAG: response regulator [Desulfuromonadales bacterium]|nr:response regulator [Desulfuromonadales bacterium]
MNTSNTEKATEHTGSNTPTYQAQTARDAVKTILLVDDDDSVREVIRHMLELCGFTILVAADAAQAIDIAQDHGDKIDLLISDVVMPGLNGLQLHQHLLLQLPSLKVIFMSGYPVNPLSLGEQLKETAHYLPKPFRADALLEKIRLIV